MSEKDAFKERVTLWWNPARGLHDPATSPHTEAIMGGVEYVRADLYDTLRAALKKIATFPVPIHEANTSTRTITNIAHEVLVP